MALEHWCLESHPAKDPVIGMLMAGLQDGTREWRGELGEVPSDALNWQPFANGPSIAAEIYHMIDTEAGWIEGAANRKRTEEEAQELLSDDIDVDAVSWPTTRASSLADLYELQDRYRRRTLETLARFEDGNQTIQWEGEDRSFTIYWILHHVITHEAYHGGQAVLIKHLWERRS